MHNIEYEIKLNDIGRPYIELSKEYSDIPDDKFFVMELARYFLQHISEKKSDAYDEETRIQLENTVTLMAQINDDMARIIYDGMVADGEIDLMISKKYHIIIETLEELESMGDIYVYNSKIFKKDDLLKVFVENENAIYCYINENWVKSDD